VLDFNRASLCDDPLSIQLNEMIERGEQPSENYRQYLGASTIGSECLRKVQFDWFCDARFPARIKDIFARGHFFEEVARNRLISVGFKFAPVEQLEFKTADGLFCGHADGVLTDGPELPGLGYPSAWEHKCLNDKNWTAIARDGLKGRYAPYRAQVTAYQAYLELADNPALFTITNANTCERLHFLVPFDPALAQAISDRAVMIIEASRAGELLPRITKDQSDWRCRMCGHRERCWSSPC
jgi:hypothetical protein